ncbi:MAG: hypothetical protein BWX94_01522 [Tenericutes bacterium ADurb.Bin140]|nr:MAG: hypothetical protein BWX94_01522 [Tenericutes bacterium ADurb.Bin140]
MSIDNIAVCIANKFNDGLTNSRFNPFDIQNVWVGTYYFDSAAVFMFENRLVKIIVRSQRFFPNSKFEIGDCFFWFFKMDIG